MTTTRRMDRYGLVSTHVSGGVSVAGLLHAVLELGELTAYSNELWEIVIVAPETHIESNHHLTMELSHSAKETIQFKSRGAIAMYAPTSRLRQMLRQVASQIRGDAVPVVVFADEADARRWLEIHRATSRYHATTRMTKTSGAELPAIH